MSELSHLDQLEAEAIYIIREVAASCEKPVMLYSIGKDSSVMLHLALKAFYPEKPPFPFLHVNTTWKFKEMIKFRDETAKKYGLEMIEYINEDGVKQGVNPFDSGAAYTDIMKTQALKQALNKYGFTAAFGGGRRDEEKSRAKERIFSFRNENQAWDPKNQRPEMWKLYNSKIKKGESIRVFAISNWTETDIWKYIKREKIDIVPLYFAKERPVIERDGNIIMVDDLHMLELFLQLCDAGFHDSLVILGLIILTVLGQVTESTGYTDLLGYFRTTSGAQLMQFFLELVKALLCHQNLIQSNHPFWCSSVKQMCVLRRIISVL